jgi:XTP/dITP diphosphohydrolase
LKARPLRELVLATHDAQLAAECADFLKPVGASVFSLTDVCLPEPSGAGTAALDRATRKASAVAWFANMPALGFAQEFCISPLLRYSDDSPQWTWPLPHSAAISKIYAEIKKADDELNRGGYCGPDDRGAFFRCVLCLAWPDMENLVLEARIEGQLGALGPRENGNAADLFTNYFVPDGEERTISSLSRVARKRYSAFRRAIALLRDLAL